MTIRHVDVFLPLNLALGIPIAVSLLSDGSAFLQVILHGTKILMRLCWHLQSGK